MAITAENCAAKYGITREASDAYALRSQQLAHRAWTSGVLAEEVVPVEVKARKGTTLVERDDHLRPETTLEGLAALPTVFKKDGVVTAGQRQRHRGRRRGAGHRLGAGGCATAASTPLGATSCRGPRWASIRP